jgi:hypothetical protein
MMNTALLTLTLSTLLCTNTYAEYRVYQYYVRPKVQNINPSKAELVTSTLNPRAYAAYHGGSLSIDLTLMRSWMCMGDTSHEDVCTISNGLELTEAAGVIK